MKSIKGIPPLLTCQALKDLLRASPRKVSVLEADFGKQFQTEFQLWVRAVRHARLHPCDLVRIFHRLVTSIKWNAPRRRKRFLAVFQRSNASRRISHVWEWRITITLYSTIVHRWVSMLLVELGGCSKSVTEIISIWNEPFSLDLRRGEFIHSQWWFLQMVERDQRHGIIGNRPFQIRQSSAIDETLVGRVSGHLEWKIHRSCE